MTADPLTSLVAEVIRTKSPMKGGLDVGIARKVVAAIKAKPEVVLAALGLEEQEPMTNVRGQIVRPRHWDFRGNDGDRVFVLPEDS